MKNIMKKITDTLARMKEYDTKLSVSGEAELESVMAELAFPGVLNPYTLGIPLAISLIAEVISFSLPQWIIWHSLFNVLKWPDYAVFSGIVPCILIFYVILFTLGSLTARGYYAALKGYFFLAIGVVLIATIGFVISLTVFVSSQNDSVFLFVTAILSIIFSMVSIIMLKTRWFARAADGFMHNRAWRKLWKLRLDKAKGRKY